HIRGLPVFSSLYSPPRSLHSFPTRRSSDLPFFPRSRQDRPARRRMRRKNRRSGCGGQRRGLCPHPFGIPPGYFDTKEGRAHVARSEEHTSELQSRENLVCRLLLEKKKKIHK